MDTVSLIEKFSHIQAAYTDTLVYAAVKRLQSGEEADKVLFETIDALSEDRQRLLQMRVEELIGVTPHNPNVLPMAPEDRRLREGLAERYQATRRSVIFLMRKLYDLKYVFPQEVMPLLNSVDGPAKPLSTDADRIADLFPPAAYSQDLADKLAALDIAGRNALVHSLIKKLRAGGGTASIAFVINELATMNAFLLADWGEHGMKHGSPMPFETPLGPDGAPSSAESDIPGAQPGRPLVEVFAEDEAKKV